MSTLIWHLRQWVRRLGLSGLIGAGLIVIAILMYQFAVQPTREIVAKQQTQLDALRSSAATQNVPAAYTPDPLVILPPAGIASQQIGELERLARAHKLELPRGQYSVAPVAGSRLVRWQLVLPVEGSYPELHAFLAAALERLPNVALDELKLKRERIEATELQAELRLSLFLETAP